MSTSGSCTQCLASRSTTACFLSNLPPATTEAQVRWICTNALPLLSQHVNIITHIHLYPEQGAVVNMLNHHFACTMAKRLHGLSVQGQHIQAYTRWNPPAVQLTSLLKEREQLQKQVKQYEHIIQVLAKGMQHEKSHLPGLQSFGPSHKALPLTFHQFCFE